MRTLFRPFSLALLFGASVSLYPLDTGLAADATAPEPSPVYKDPAAPVEARVADLLTRLTPDEKLLLLGGTGFTTQPVARLGLPAFVMSDGPVGARNSGPTTAYTAGVALAASWNKGLAQQVGAALGRDCRARGIHMLLGPGINLYRAPMCGRNFEYFGEDPVLSGKTAAAYICGVQSQGVAATVKHFAVNNQEFSRHNLGSDLDETTLRELYTRNFLIAVRDGAPKCLMTSYNPINGVHASQNRTLNVDILKGEFGFEGLVMSDWDSCYDTLGMAQGGLDLEMPKAIQYKADKVRPLLASGQVTPEVLDDKVRRQLRVGFEMGWFDHPQLDPSISKDDPNSADVALDEAREGVVLLKNKDNLLPLDKTKIKQIAVVGPNGGHPVTGGGGSSYVKSFHAVSLVDGLKGMVDDASKIVYLAWKLGTAPSDDAMRIVRESDAVVVSVGFDWPGVRNSGPDDGFFSTEHEFPPQEEGEGGDRAYAMPPGTAELINAVAGINPRTVVLINAGGSVETAGWIDHAAALVHAFYPGQAGGTALAEIIFGAVNPSGKLPFSWEKRWEDSAAYGHYPDKSHPKTNDYAEGVLMGYRWFDAKKIDPLFPFGFGLSYTQFELSDFKASKGGTDGEVEFTVKVKNTGQVAGAEIVQVYAEGTATQAAGRPTRELKAYGKVSLQPGEEKMVGLKLDPADLAAWDASAHHWTAAKGEQIFQVGDSSRNLVLRTSLSL